MKAEVIGVGFCKEPIGASSTEFKNMESIWPGRKLFEKTKN
jgi:hypothetical protein